MKKGLLIESLSSRYVIPCLEAIKVAPFTEDRFLVAPFTEDKFSNSALRSRFRSATFYWPGWYTFLFNVSSFNTIRAALASLLRLS